MAGFPVFKSRLHTPVEVPVPPFLIIKADYSVEWRERGVLFKATFRTPDDDRHFGIDELEALDIGQFFGSLVGGQYDTAISFGLLNVSPWSDFRNQLDSRLLTEQGALGRAFARWSDPRTDELLDAFVHTADFDEQFKALEELQMIYVENAINVPLLTRFTTYQYNTRRFTGFPTNENYYTTGAPVSEEGRLQVVLNVHCKNSEACQQ